MAKKGAFLYFKITIPVFLLFSLFIFQYENFRYKKIQNDIQEVKLQRVIQIDDSLQQIDNQILNSIDKEKIENTNDLYRLREILILEKELLIVQEDEKE